MALGKQKDYATGCAVLWRGPQRGKNPEPYLPDLPCFQLWHLRTFLGVTYTCPLMLGCLWDKWTLSFLHCPRSTCHMFSPWGPIPGLR